MARLTFTGKLRLLATDAGGRKGSIRTDHRAVFDIGDPWMGEPVVNSGRVRLIDHEALAPGAEGRVQIDLLFAEHWATVREGMVVAVQEGARVVGHMAVEHVLFADGFSPAVAAFVRASREFSRFIGEAGELPEGERLSGARRSLLALCTAAVGLPSVAPPAETPSTPRSESPSNWQEFGRFESYWDVFDPYTRENPTEGWLSSDLLGAYQHVRCGLALWDRGHDAHALWEWHFSFDSHWGDSAVDALRALHRACGRGAW